MVSYVGRCAPAVAVPPASMKGGEPATELTSSRSNTTNGDATVGVSVACNAARTAGTATFNVFLSGTNTGFGVTLNGTNTNNFSATQASGADTFVANDRIDVRMTTSSWTPTSADCEVTVTVQY